MTAEPPPPVEGHPEEDNVGHLRDLVRRNADLERLVAELDAFSYSVAHELRGPLHVIGGFARMLELNDSTLMSMAGRKRLQRIIESANEMDRLIEDLLACARADHVEIRLEPTPLDELAREVLRELRPAYARTRVVVFELPVVNADPALARQVLANLVGNALKFSALQAEPLVEIGVLEGDEAGAIFVRDNGVGFAPEQADQLFKPFERMHGDPAYPGTGVGLSIVKRFIERHGGWISAHSQVGGPTEFRLRFAR